MCDTKERQQLHFFDDQKPFLFCLGFFTSCLCFKIQADTLRMQFQWDVV